MLHVAGAVNLVCTETRGNGGWDIVDLVPGAVLQASPTVLIQLAGPDEFDTPASNHLGVDLCLILTQKKKILKQNGSPSLPLPWIPPSPSYTFKARKGKF